MNNEEARMWFIQESEKDITEGEFRAFSIAIKALSQPEVIRCKDCKHWRQPNIILNGKSEWSGFCKHMDGVGDPEGFCYRAERRG